MPDHLTPLLLAVAFALVWLMVGATHVADSIHEVRKRREGKHGPHFDLSKPATQKKQRGAGVTNR